MIWDSIRSSERRSIVSPCSTADLLPLSRTGKKGDGWLRFVRDTRSYGGFTIWLWLTVCHGKSPFLIGKPSISMGHFDHGYVSLPEGISIPGGFMVDFSRGIHGFIASNIPVDSGWNSVRILWTKPMDSTMWELAPARADGLKKTLVQDFSHWFLRFHNCGKIHHSTMLCSWVNQRTINDHFQ